MRVRHLATGATLALLCSVLIGGTTAARSDRQTTAVMWHAQTGLSGPVGSGAAAQLVRRDGGVSFEMSTAQLRQRSRARVAAHDDDAVRVCAQIEAPAIGAHGGRRAIAVWAA